MDAQEAKIGKKVMLFSCGLIPGCDLALQRFNKKPSSCISQIKLDQLEKIASSLRSTDETIQAFLDAYPSWANERLVCIIEINELANNIDFHHRNINIAQLPTSAVGVGGGILTITSLLLIPATSGASLALTISGAVIAAGATATGITTSVTDIGIRVHRSKKAKACVDKHKQRTEVFFKLAQELANKCSEVEAMSALKDNEIQLAGEATKVFILGFKNARNALIETIPKASKSLHLLKTGYGLEAGARGFSTSLRTVDAAADVASGATKVVATTTGKVFTAIGIVVDLVSAGAAIYDLAKGSKTSVSTKLREQAENLLKELEVFEDVYIELSK